MTTPTPRVSDELLRSMRDRYGESPEGAALEELLRLRSDPPGDATERHFLDALAIATNGRSYPNCDLAAQVAGKIVDKRQADLAKRVVALCREWIDQSYKLEGRDPKTVRTEMAEARGDRAEEGTNTMTDPTPSLSTAEAALAAAGVTALRDWLTRSLEALLQVSEGPNRVENHRKGCIGATINNILHALPERFTRLGSLREQHPTDPGVAMLGRLRANLVRRVNGPRHSEQEGCAVAVAEIDSMLAAGIRTERGA